MDTKYKKSVNHFDQYKKVSCFKRGIKHIGMSLIGNVLQGSNRVLGGITPSYY